MYSNNMFLIKNTVCCVYKYLRGIPEHFLFLNNKTFPFFKLFLIQNINTFLEKTCYIRLQD